PIEQLDAVAAAIAKHEDVTRQRVIAQVLPDQLGQSVEALTQVRRCQGQPNAHGRGEAQHDRPSSTASNCRKGTASNPAATRTIRPSVRPTCRALAWASTGSATTCTGTNAAGSSAARR